jgi:hypothetical protein
VNATLYRFFDETSTLLYVGQTTNWGARFLAHAGDKPWWAEVVRVTLEHYDDADECARAEARAILDENPRFNRLRREVVEAPPTSGGRPRRSELYHFDFYCGNCGRRGFSLPKGTVLANHDCESCEVPGTLLPGERP